MAPSLQLQGGVILIWLFMLSTGVSSYKNECWTFLCVTDPSLNCTCKPEVPNWLMPTICLVPLAIIGSCCIRMCIYYYKEREGTRHPGGSTLSRSHSVSMPDLLSASNFEFRTPPSYNEAISKPDCCPSLLDDPPTYEDIAMLYVSPPDISIPIVLIPKNNTSTV